MLSLKLQYNKNSIACKKFALSGDVLSSSVTNLQEKERKTMPL